MGLVVCNVRGRVIIVFRLENSTANARSDERFREAHRSENIKDATAHINSRARRLLRIRLYNFKQHRIDNGRGSFVLGNTRISGLRTRSITRRTLASVACIDHAFFRMFVVRLFRNEDLAFSGFVDDYIDYRILVFGRNCSFLLRLLVFRRRGVPFGSNFFFFARHFADFHFSHFRLN